MPRKNVVRIGLKDGRLNLCDSAPNCVCTFQDPKDSHFIEPKPMAENPIEKTKSVLKKLGMKIISSRGNYIHAQATSSFFKFVDDIEVLYDEEAKLLHFRSASQIGYSDLGVNRKRIEKIKSHL